MPNPVDIYVGKRMRQRREMQGLPQKELASKLGISFQQVQKYESGANRISASKLWQLCDVLEVEPGYFFDGLDSNRATQREALPQAATSLPSAFQMRMKMSAPVEPPGSSISIAWSQPIPVWRSASRRAPSLVSTIPCRRLSITTKSLPSPCIFVNATAVIAGL